MVGDDLLGPVVRLREESRENGSNVSIPYLLYVSIPIIPIVINSPKAFHLVRNIIWTQHSATPPLST